MEAGWLDDADLGDLIEHLRDQRDFGIQELLFSHLGERLRVTFLDERATCSPAAMLALLAAISPAA